MFRLGLRFWLVPAVACALLPGCASYYRLDVGGDQAEHVRSVFLIVADRDPLGGDDENAAGLIHPQKIGDYLLFAQFDPADESPLRWREESINSRSPLLTVELSKDQRIVSLWVDKELREVYGDLTIVAVGHGSDGWYSETIDSGSIRLEKGSRLDAGPARFGGRPFP